MGFKPGQKGNITCWAGYTAVIQLHSPDHLTPEHTGEMKGSTSAASLSIICLSICWLCLLDATDPSAMMVHPGAQTPGTSPTVTSRLEDSSPHTTIIAKRNHSTTIAMTTGAAATASEDRATAGTSGTTTPVSDRENKETTGTSTPSLNTTPKVTIENKKASSTLKTESATVSPTERRRVKMVIVLVLLLLFCLCGLSIFLTKRRNREQVRDWVRSAESRFGVQVCPVWLGGHGQGEADTSSLAEEGEVPNDDSSDDYSSFGGMNLREGIKTIKEGQAQDGGDKDDDQEGKDGSDTAEGQEEGAAEAVRGGAGDMDITIL
ncbi:hypothetical protein GN956_G12435 [Arapaima gigas]